MRVECGGFLVTLWSNLADDDGEAGRRILNGKLDVSRSVIIIRIHNSLA